MTRTAARDLTTTPLGSLVDLTGRTVVITGAAQGLGLAIAHRLAEAGATLVISDRDERSLNRAVAEIRLKWSVAVHASVADVTDSVAVERLADLGDSVGSGIAIWVNNAGSYPTKAVVDLSDDEWQEVVAVNLDGTLYGCRAAAKKMAPRSGLPGRVIINVSSLAGMRGRKNLSSYVAVKHGVTGLVRALAVELGEAGIRVVGVAPSMVDTPGMRLRRESASEEQAAALQELESNVSALVPLGRSGIADDVARAVLYLASDLAEYVTGIILNVDGGVSAS